METSVDGTDQSAQEEIIVPWVDFLQDHPPGGPVRVSDAAKQTRTCVELLVPHLRLHCPQESCNGAMFFKSQSHAYPELDKWTYEFLVYTCRNCGRYAKVFAVAVLVRQDAQCYAMKFGEYPPFGPPVPARALRLIQPDKELFLRGRRCENQGLGVGAFAYYRRVVENQWARLVDEIIKVGKKTRASNAIIAALESVKDEHQFAKAVKDVRDAIPPSLLIDGHNPLILLHSALSEGVHDLPDEECLSLARSIRVVLVELAERLGDALRNENELAEAVSRLMNKDRTKTAGNN